MTKMKMTLVLALFVLLSSFAFAATVKYQTCYGATASPCASTGTVSGGTLFTATYAASGLVTVLDPIAVNGVNRNFGTVKVKCNGSCTGGSASTSFDVTISQSLPGVGHQKVTATLSGFFVLTNGIVSIVWNGPVAIHAGGFTTIYSPIGGGGFCTGGSCSFALKVDISQVTGTVLLPEPSAELLLGLGSLGLVGLATLSRKMISA